MQRLAGLFFWMLASTSALAATEVMNVKPLMLAAIDSPDGTAKGILVGPIAEKMHQVTRSREPVQVEVTTLKSFQKEGCKRLNVRLMD